MGKQRVIGKVLLGLSVGFLYAIPAATQTLTVDGSTTIQQAIADAHRFPPGQWVTILVAPGDYYGPVIVDRPKTRLVAQSVPVFSGATVVGHNPAVFIHPPGDPALGTLGITASNVEVSGFDVDAGARYGISAFGFPPDKPGADDILQEISGVVISGNVVTNAFAAIQITQASAVVSGNTSNDAGHIGIVVTGGPIVLGGANVTVTRNVFNNKAGGAAFFGALDSPFEFPRSDGSAGSLTVMATGNDFSNSIDALVLGPRGAFPLSGEPGTLSAIIQDNQLGKSKTGVAIRSEQCFFTDVCTAGAPSSVDALLINNELSKTVTSAGFTFQLAAAHGGTFKNTGIYLQNSSIRVRTVKTALGQFFYDNAGGGNTLIVDGQSFTGTARNRE
jgi:hypothetical protein